MVRIVTQYFFHSSNSIQLIQNEVQTTVEKQKQAVFKPIHVAHYMSFIT